MVAARFASLARSSSFANYFGVDTSGRVLERSKIFFFDDSFFYFEDDLLDILIGSASILFQL